MLKLHWISKNFLKFVLPSPYLLRNYYKLFVKYFTP
uniref:Uncharacterized protein n=1 Tax=Rhizophora mucronata TaxID=61149 RepID=A0A2P2KJC2_RHIMU